MKTTRQTVAIDSIIPNPRNNRMHPPEQLEMLKASIRRFGQPRPVLVRKTNRMLIAGHGIHQAMRETGATQIDVIWWDVEQNVADEFLLADNRLTELSHFDGTAPAPCSRTSPRTPTRRSVSRARTLMPC
jgi:ParB-like chromosome segregation protein Spo0J